MSNSEILSAPRSVIKKLKLLKVFSLHNEFGSISAHVPIAEPIKKESPFEILSSILSLSESSAVLTSCNPQGLKSPGTSLIGLNGPILY